MSRSEQMTRIRSKNTKPEMLLRRALWRRGLRYRIHTNLLGSPDFAFPGKRVAVFVDGCFWHGCPEHYVAPKANPEFWRAKVERNLQRDASVDAQLQREGWIVIRVWEHQVRSELEATVAFLTEVVRRPTGTLE
ncbi:MAG: very short patch repair endonuclease [Gemmatimonadota bacterium]